jgi:hypothetical protein
MTITAFGTLLNPGATVQAPANQQTVIVRMRLPNTGSFVLFGRIVAANASQAASNATISLTTLDGETSLDVATVTLSGGFSTSVSLQAILTMGAQNVNEIVDIRCQPGAPFNVNSISLTAISVDATASALA